MSSWSSLSRALAAATLLPTLALAAPRPEPTTPAKAGAVRETARPSKHYAIEQFMKTTLIRGASFSPDEQRVLYSSNQTGIYNVFSVPVKGGKPTQLTRSTTDSTFAVGYFPQDERILFTKDQGGNEQHHLYVRTPDGKEKDLTPGDKHRASFFGWSRDESAFYVLTNERDERFMDLYRYDAKTFERTLLYQNEGGLDVGDVSPDEKWLSLGKTNTTSDSDVYLFNVATKESKHLSPHKGIATWESATFDPTSSSLYLITDEGTEFTRAVRYVLATGKMEDVEKTDWDVMYTYFSKNGALRVTGINADGRTAIRLHDVKAGKQLDLPKLPEGDITGVSIGRSEKRMAFHHNGDRSPSNLYVFDFATKKVTRLTDTLNPEIDAKDLVDAEVVRFKSFDGMEIPNILFKPHQATAKQQAPALVWVHGGPGGQSRKGYNPMIQYLVNHGYVVLAINNRGSSGYGKTFYTADDQKHGKEPLQDCVEAKKYLATLPYVDGSRVGIIGGSYGGYMTLAALAFQPDVFNVGVDIFGVSNWLRTLKSMPAHWESRRQALYQEVGNPETQEAMLREVSPLFHAEKIRKPLLVIQGANDPRVLKAESDEIVQAVQKSKVPVEYVLFPDEGHGFTKKKNEAEAYSRTRAFLDQYLKKPANAPTN
ncbi:MULTISPECIES: alpha/beta fold hydrolase [Myxococcus]|uniref:Acyl-peptide hydrolase n=1 Tax=Myxococcus llanfairpwllgwyngyllgogerychwyrndrobwllllantysiliogogogochensis TaxID=2590453 RepID=A0A540WQD6_9BACT|nr:MULTISPECIES: alpha/beta fold hydrolase [Myxococcus]NTX03443.1 S9 family peptidase [Myxococcus sp. CA040A]TQF11231.1 S9 family peptidase [Myxococcus llanfairpwllgwyngyllgogerychwyrndrobwllllantysiliogogogochensis]